jgi:hypothetical protein
MTEPEALRFAANLLRTETASSPDSAWHPFRLAARWLDDQAAEGEQDD